MQSGTSSIFVFPKICVEQPSILYTISHESRLPNGRNFPAIDSRTFICIR